MLQHEAGAVQASIERNRDSARAPAVPRASRPRASRPRASTIRPPREAARHRERAGLRFRVLLLSGRLPIGIPPAESAASSWRRFTSVQSAAPGTRISETTRGFGSECRTAGKTIEFRRQACRPAFGLLKKPVAPARSDGIDSERAPWMHRRNHSRGGGRRFRRRRREGRRRSAAARLRCGGGRQRSRSPRVAPRGGRRARGGRRRCPCATASPTLAAAREDHSRRRQHLGRHEGSPARQPAVPGSLLPPILRICRATRRHARARVPARGDRRCRQGPRPVQPPRRGQGPMR